MADERVFYELTPNSVFDFVFNYAVERGWLREVRLREATMDDIYLAIEEYRYPTGVKPMLVEVTDDE